MFKNEKNEKPEHSQQKPAEAKAEQTVEQLQKELLECKDRHLRLVAEFENVRKRFERDKIEFVKYANEGLIKDFLGILDDLERSVQAAPQQHKDYDSFRKGIELVMARVYEMLKQNDVHPIAAVGKRFDPHCHEVLMQVESNEHEDATVVEEFQKGYLLGDKVIRTAKVKVAVHPQPKDSEQVKPAPESA